MKTEDIFFITEGNEESTSIVAWAKYAESLRNHFVNKHRNCSPLTAVIWIEGQVVVTNEGRRIRKNTVTDYRFSIDVPQSEFWQLLEDWGPP